VLEQLSHRLDILLGVVQLLRGGVEGSVGWGLDMEFSGCCMVEVHIAILAGLA